MLSPPFLRIPPFPRHRAAPLCRPAPDGAGADTDLDILAKALADARVGGGFWHPQTDPWAGYGDDQEARLAHDLLAGGAAARMAAARIVAGWRVCDPYTGAPIGWLTAVALLAEWRRLIMENRAIAASFGIARWKRETLDALLWDGTGPPRYARSAARLPAGAQALVWVARASAGLVGRLGKRGVRVGEIEDGFIRSSGLGADCVPPLSVVVDMLGSHVDPARPSTIESLLARADFPPALLARAAALRAELVASGIGKYGGAAPVEAAARVTRRRVLVCGQVEDDRAVLLGGAGVTNTALLARARALEPDAEIIWRPHPDVEAGHRKGAIAVAEVTRLADRTERSAPIAALFAGVDAVHVISSLAGFEALLRGLDVTTHGLPFYAGWGLTRDLAEVPARRQAAARPPVSLDMLVAAALILYPRYLDPISRLPCGPELLVRRMRDGTADMASPLVPLRRGLGRLRKLLRR